MDQFEVPPPPYEEPSSRNIPVPEEMRAECPEHGMIASITIAKGDALAYIVRCGRCGRPCTLSHE